MSSENERKEAMFVERWDQEEGSVDEEEGTAPTKISKRFEARGPLIDVQAVLPHFTILLMPNF